MSVVKKCGAVFQKMMRDLLFRLKLMGEDEWWHFTGADSWGLFPPSFYYLHTKDEVARARAALLKELREMINDNET